MVPPGKNQTGMGATDHMHIHKAYPTSSDQRSGSFLLVLASVNLPRLFLDWCHADTRQGKKSPYYT